jgi:hypothetical protein
MMTAKMSGYNMQSILYICMFTVMCGNIRNLTYVFYSAIIQEQEDGTNLPSTS